MTTQNRDSIGQEIEVPSARSGSAPPAALGSAARSNARPTFLSSTAMQISTTSVPGLGLAGPSSFNEPGLVSRGLSEDFKITERVEEERSKGSRPASTSLSSGDSYSSPLPGSAQSSGITVPALHPTLSADLPSVQLAKSLSPNKAGKTAVRLGNSTDAHTAAPLQQQDSNGKLLPATTGVHTDATGGTTSPADMMGLVTRALAEGMNLNNVLDGLTAPTKPGSPSQDEAAEPGQPGWHWPVADPRSSGPADHPTWGGMWTGPDTAQQFSPAPNSSSQKASGFATAAGYLSQDQLLPACLLLSSRNTPSPKHSTAWATNHSQFSPTHNSFASQLAPAGESGSISHAPSSNGRSVDGGNASGATSAEAGATLSPTNVDILSTALEKLRPDELELLASMEPSQFQSLMFSAVASLAGTQDGAAPARPHPEAGMAAAGSNPSNLSMQQLQAMLQLGGGSQQGAAGVRLLQQQLQQQQAKVPLQPPVTAGQLQALFQMFPPLPQQENVVNSPLMNGYRPALVPASPFAVGMHPMYQLGLQSPPGAHPPPPPPRSHLAGATEGEGSWEELTQTVRDKVQSMVMRCEPHIKLSHFDGGVRHWLAQLTSLFGESAALSGLATIEQATNLAGVRNMRAFITTRLIDCFEQHIFQRDPAGYAARRLLPEQYQLLDELVSSGQGLQWTHFDPKVLDTIRDLGSLDYTRARLARLSARELASVQNVPAYIFTLLSKRGKTAKQAAAAKGASVAALSALLDAALAPVHSPPGSSPGLYSHPGSSLPRMNAMGSMNSLQLSPDTSHLQRSFTMGAPSVHQGSPIYGTSMGTLNDMLSPMPDMQYSGGGGGGYVRRPMQAMPTRSQSMQHDMLTAMPVSPLPQYSQLAAAQLAMLQQRQQHVASPPSSAFRVASQPYFNSPSAYMN